MYEKRFVDPTRRFILLSIGVYMILFSLGMVLIPGPIIGWALRHIPRSPEAPDPWANSPMLFYMLRTAGTAYIWLGVCFLVASTDPGRYSGLVLASGIMMIVMAAVCIVSGLLYRLPGVVYLGDGVMLLLGGALTLRSGPWLMRRKAGIGR